MLTQIISLASQKGGTGKSTTTLNLGYSLASLGNHVLLIDGDPQGGLSLGTNIGEKEKPGLADILTGKAKPDECIVNSRNLTLSALGSGHFSTDSLMKSETQAGKHILMDAVISVSQGFNYVLIDCPAGMGSFVRAFLSVSNSVLIPLNMRNTAVRSLPVFLQFIEDIRNKYNAALTVEGILVTMLDFASRSEIEIFKTAKETLPTSTIFKTVINHDYIFEDLSLSGAACAMSRKATKAARGYFELALELHERKINRIKGDEDEEFQGLF